MRKKILLLIILSLLIIISCNNKSDKTAAEKAGWNLSMQSYSLRLFTVPEALDKTAQLGLKFIEIYPGQRMGSEFGDALFGYDLTTQQQESLKELAKAKNIKIISSGVWTAASDEWSKIFNFAKNMGMDYISAEPARSDWDIVEALSKEYNIKVAVHNHPNENSYWKPEILLDYIGNRSSLLGSCADIGHYKRMGVEPLPALKELEGRIISMHFKDIALVEPEITNEIEGVEENNVSYEDVIWGTGVLELDEILKELNRQNFKGYFTIEYEADWENNLPQIKESIDYFNNSASIILE